MAGCCEEVADSCEEVADGCERVAERCEEVRKSCGVIRDRSCAEICVDLLGYWTAKFTSAGLNCATTGVVDALVDWVGWVEEEDLEGFAPGDFLS